MTSQEPEFLDRLRLQVANGDFRTGECLNCASRDAQVHHIYAICRRAEREFESDGSRSSSYTGVFMRIPYWIPIPTNKTIEVRHGDDIVVPLELSACDRCWQELDGNRSKLMAVFSQGLFVLGLLMIVIWAIARVRQADISFWYVVGVFAAALPFHIAGEMDRSRWPRRLRAFLAKIPPYSELLAAYPQAEFTTREPTALISAADSLNSQDS